MEDDTSSFSPSGHPAHPYSRPSSSSLERHPPSATAVSGASPSTVRTSPYRAPATYGDSALPAAAYSPHFHDNTSSQGVSSLRRASTLGGTAPSYGPQSLHRTSSSPAYTLPGPSSLLESRVESPSSSNLQTSSRYLADRKRRLSSLTSSPERQPSRRVTAGPSELLRDSLIRRRVTGPSTSSYNTGHSSHTPELQARRVSNMNPDVASASSSTPTNHGPRRSSTTTQPILIDLTGDDDSSGQGRPASSSRMSTERRNSDGRRVSRGGAVYNMDEIVLPIWQPDNEVTNCPVCGTKFSWYFRKHHCRKCGRVVCNNCSPHRITIPRQFIVKPPTTIDLTGADDNGSPVPDNIWGGAEVRVCNPCVPDPNFSPPGQPTSPHLHPSGQMPGWHPYPFNSQSGLSAGSNRTSTSFPGYGYQQGQLPPLPGQQNIHQGQPPHPGSYAQYQFRNPSSIRDLWPPTAPPHPSAVLHQSQHPQSQHTHQPQGRQNPLSYAFRGLPLNPFPWASGADSDSQSGTPPDSPHRHLASRQPRREIPEEDECPVCGEELPPKGPDGSTTEREGHIEDCIKNRSYGATSPQPTTPSNRPGDINIPVGSFASNSSRRRMTGAGRMLKYKATEKDYVDEDTGGRQECIICFEEFEVGDMMGRLECLCKFHHECIRQWWETRGDGSCPTHQLHE